ncbi:hypothetical protein JTE90_024446 [Oedothorax gibbosus]|uniref:Uncharacterized protein n=1 Tax=Oedothorax gibbosus TaxID=931172 RepID=A0AAV6UAV4_9ARAC|nr:hypothetical protein JTE90_024446 [Oedothorax gibbosus]
MAKILKNLVFGQKKNPPAPPQPDYQGEGIPKGPFADHDYENIPRFTGEKSRVQFQEKKKPELVVFENYSEPADLLRDDSSSFQVDEDCDPVYMSPVDDASNNHEDVYCVPYEDDEARPPPLPSPCMAPGMAFEI